MKWFWLIVMVILLGVSAVFYSRTTLHLRELGHRAEMIEEAGDPDSEAGRIAGEIQSLEGQKTLNGILLTLSGATLAGILFTSIILPRWIDRVAEGVYGSGVQLEKTTSHEAHALLARGEFEEAIEAFRTVIAEEPENRSPWAEISKIQRRNLDDPEAAIRTLQQAIATREWPADDKAFFLFRLAEIYNENSGNRDQAVSMLRQVIAEFPESRHSANAVHRLNEWGIPGI